MILKYYYNSRKYIFFVKILTVDLCNNEVAEQWKDLNEDGVIDSYDRTYKNGFYSTGMPEIVYGFGLNVSWKGLFVGVFFQGVANASASLIASPSNIIPFTSGRDNASARDIIRDRWSADEPSNQQVFFPRLHTGAFEHNQMPSTWWMRDAGVP